MLTSRQVGIDSSIAKAGDRFFEFVLVLSEAVIVLVIEKIAEA